MGLVNIKEILSYCVHNANLRRRILKTSAQLITGVNYSKDAYDKITS